MKKLRNIFEARCAGCDYLATFDSESLAMTAAQMHRNLGYDHICNCYDILNRQFIPFRSKGTWNDVEQVSALTRS